MLTMTLMGRFFISLAERHTEHLQWTRALVLSQHQPLWTGKNGHHTASRCLLLTFHLLPLGTPLPR